MSQPSKSLDNILSTHPSLIYKNIKDEVISFIESVIGTVLNVLRGMLAITLLVATIGIFNTLILSVVERRREIGILRAVGMDGRRVCLMINYEAIMMSLYGVIAGHSRRSFLCLDVH